MRWIVLVFLLTGCASARYAPCPTLVTYTVADQMALADEMKKYPRPQIIRWIGDYIGLRDQIRACVGHYF